MIDSRVECVDIGLIVVGNSAMAEVCSHSLDCIRLQSHEMCAYRGRTIAGYIVRIVMYIQRFGYSGLCMLYVGGSARYEAGTGHGECCGWVVCCDLGVWTLAVDRTIAGVFSQIMVRL